MRPAGSSAYLLSLFPGVTALMPAAATSTVVPTTVAPMLTAVEATETAALATPTTAHPFDRMQSNTKRSVNIRLFMETGFIYWLESCSAALG